LPIPTEFQFERNVQRRFPRRLRRVCRSVLGFDPRPKDAIVQAFGEMYYDADPLAEAFVADAFDGLHSREGWAMLDQAIEQGVASVPDAPASLHALFADIETPPSWFQPDRVERGAKAFRRWGTDVFFFAGAITLEAYHENSVAKPLALSGSYADNGTRKRFLETARFWVDVSEPNGLSAGQPGLKAALRVRIMHVFIRSRLVKHPEWDLDAWGVPISQADAMLTLLGGSLVPGVGLHALGYLTSKRDIEDLLHFWRYVGHLMGVRPKWYPNTVTEACQALFVGLVRGVGRAGDDEQRLVHSYINGFDGWDGRQARGFTRLFMPPWSYKRNGLPSARRATLQVLSKAPAVLALELARRVIPGLDALADRNQRRARSAWLHGHLKGKPAKYRPNERFTR